MKRKKYLFEDDKKEEKKSGDESAEKKSNNEDSIKEELKNRITSALKKSSDEKSFYENLNANKDKKVNKITYRDKYDDSVDFKIHLNNNDEISINTSDLKLNSGELQKLKNYSKNLDKSDSQRILDERDVQEIFKNLGTVAVLRNSTGSVKAKELLTKISEMNYDEVYKLAFENYNVFSNDFFNGMTIEKAMQECAKCIAVERCKEKTRIAKEAYDKFVKKENDKDVDNVERRKYIDEAVKDKTIEPRYNSIKNSLELQFEKGVEEAYKKLNDGEEIIEPFTNKRLNKDGEASAALKKIGEGAKKLGDVFGLSENSPDFFSKLVFGVIAGGKAIFKKIKRKRALARFRNNKASVKSFKKTTSEKIKNGKELLKKIKNTK